MSTPLTQTAKILRQLPKALLMMLVIAAPVLAMPAIRDGGDRFIEAPAMQKTGAGFVLLVSLRRS